MARITSILILVLAGCFASCMVTDPPKPVTITTLNPDLAEKIKEIITEDTILDDFTTPETNNLGGYRGLTKKMNQGFLIEHIDENITFVDVDVNVDNEGNVLDGSYTIKEGDTLVERLLFYNRVVNILKMKTLEITYTAPANRKYSINYLQYHDGLIALDTMYSKVHVDLREGKNQIQILLDDFSDTPKFAKGCGFAFEGPLTLHEIKLLTSVPGDRQLKDHQPEDHQPEDHQPEDHQPEDHQPKDHQPEDHQPKDHQPKDHQHEDHQKDHQHEDHQKDH